MPALGLLFNAAARKSSSLMGPAVRTFASASNQLCSGLDLDGRAATRAVHGKFLTRGVVLAQGQKNAQQGMAMLSTALAATNQIKAMLDRGTEIVTQCNSASLSDAERGLASKEYESMFVGNACSLPRVLANAKWGETALLSGAPDAAAAAPPAAPAALALAFQVAGEAAPDNLLTVQIPAVNLAANGFFGAAVPIAITDMASAQAEAVKLQAALTALDDIVANLEATKGQLEAASLATGDTLANVRSATSTMGDSEVLEAMQEKEGGENRVTMCIAVTTSAMAMTRSALQQMASVISGR